MTRSDRKLNRLHDFDYSQDALYFVTLCVKDKVCVFGEVVNEEMQLNEYGHIAERQWYWLAEQYSYIILHAFVGMPNHMHGIIEIDRENIVGTGRDLSNHARVISHEKAGRDLSLQHQKIKSLSELMGAYKTTTSKLIRLAGLPDFAWQRSFHDHIIWHNSAYIHIRNYIQENPAKWQDDMFYLPEK